MLMLGVAVVGMVVVSSPAVIARRALAAAWVAAAGGLLLTITDQRASTGTSLTNLLSSSTGQKLTAQTVAVGLAGVAVVWACLRPNRFDSTVEDYDSGEPVPAEAVSLRFQLDDRPDVATATLDLTQDPDSHWRGSGSQLSIDGRWTVTALVQTPTDAVEVPMALETTAPGQPETPAATEERNCG